MPPSNGSLSFINGCHQDCITEDADAGSTQLVQAQGLSLGLTLPLGLHLDTSHADCFPEWPSPWEQLQIPPTS